MADFSTARRVMVDNQIRTFDVTDRDVLAAFETVPREFFVAPEDIAAAYADRQLSLGGRALLPPLLLARLVQALQPQAGETALDVMGGHGYSAAILAALGLKTTFLETDPALVEGARAALAKAGAEVEILPAQPVEAATRPLTARRFDVILVNGATERDPSGLIELLNDGGRLGIFSRQRGGVRAEVHVMSNGHASPRRAFDAVVPVLPGFAAEPGFVF